MAQLALGLVQFHFEVHPAQQDTTTTYTTQVDIMSGRFARDRVHAGNVARCKLLLTLRPLSLTACHPSDASACQWSPHTPTNDKHEKATQATNGASAISTMKRKNNCLSQHAVSVHAGYLYELCQIAITIQTKLIPLLHLIIQLMTITLLQLSILIV